MQLCHTITVLADYSMQHAIHSEEQLARLQKNCSLTGPFKPSFSTQSFAVVHDDHAKAWRSDSFDSQRAVKISLTIVDDLEKKPLFLGMSSARSLFLIGELIDGFAESVALVGFTLTVIKPEQESQSLDIEFIVPHAMPTTSMIGGVLCVMTMVDALLFARGLTIADETAKVLDGSPGETSALAEIWERFVSRHHG